MSKNSGYISGAMDMLEKIKTANDQEKVTLLKHHPEAEEIIDMYYQDIVEVISRIKSGQIKIKEKYRDRYAKYEKVKTNKTN